MTTESRGRDLFIVDNSVSGWTGLRYLEEWSSIAKAFDILTRRTGLMIAVRPSDKGMLEKFQLGELTGFSIGGTRGEDEEV